MDTLLAAGLELDQRHEKYQETVTAKLDAFKTLLDKAKDNLHQDPSQTTKILTSLRDKVNKLQLPKSQKDFQSTLSKFGKDIDRKFKQDISVIYQPDSFAGKEHLIQRALAMHFIRQGQFDMCDAFMAEMMSSHGTLPDTNLSVSDPALVAAVNELKSQFRQMYTIIQQLEQEKNLEQAIQWAQQHRQELSGLSSSLEFNLHRLKFIQLKLNGQLLEAVAYSRRHLSQFEDKHLSEIMRLMTSTIYDDLENSSHYGYLCSPSLWTDIRHEFQRDFCSLLNMSAESPLYASVYVGTTALPVIMKLHKIMAAKRAEWSQQDELPVEVPMDDELRFHSVFACPVSKEQATDENPPMMMPCGHVICKESLTRLSRNSRYGRNAMRFKCPYCPSESGVDEAVQVTF